MWIFCSFWRSFWEITQSEAVSKRVNYHNRPSPRLVDLVHFYHQAALSFAFACMVFRTNRRLRRQLLQFPAQAVADFDATSLVPFNVDKL